MLETTGTTPRRFKEAARLFAIIHARRQRPAAEMSRPDAPAFYPAAFPHDLAKKPRLTGEALVYKALKAALPSSWTIFYDWPVPGTRRRVDFLCVDPERGIAAFEVKGGLVHQRRASFVQRVHKSGVRRRIAPFGQLQLGLKEVMACCGLEAEGIALHASIFFPQMGQGAFTFGEGRHMFTRGDLDPQRLWAKLTPSLPERSAKDQADALRRFISALVRGRTRRRLSK